MDLSGARPAGERRTGRQDETQTARTREQVLSGVTSIDARGHSGRCDGSPSGVSRDAPRALRLFLTHSKSAPLLLDLVLLR